MQIGLGDAKMLCPKYGFKYRDKYPDDALRARDSNP